MSAPRLHHVPTRPARTGEGFSPFVDARTGEHFPASGQRQTDVRLFVEGGHEAGYALGIIGRGEGARQVTGGPCVMGPWLYSSPHATCITSSPDTSGTSADIRRAKAAGLVLSIRRGDLLEVDGDLFLCTFASRDYSGRGLHLQLTHMPVNPEGGAL